MRIFILLLSCAVDYGSVFALAGEPAFVDKGDQFSVVAYLPEWRFESANYETICNYTSHLIFFSVEPDHEGGILGMDRFPAPDILMDARIAAKRYGCKLMICFGGNGRSSGFSSSVNAKTSRKNFVKNIGNMIRKYRFDGVDINWEYPGYEFGRGENYVRCFKSIKFNKNKYLGYASEADIKKDYNGLMLVLKLLRKNLGEGRIISLAYYPDRRQEKLLFDGGAEKYVDLMHMMTYDQSSGHHSTMELSTASVAQAIAIGLSPQKLTLGLPFYGRHSRRGDWTTYEDIVQNAGPLSKYDDEVFKDANGFVGFNGIATITAKVAHAVRSKLGGAMIWEVGQDCRLEAVTRYGRTHGVTCPGGVNSSLLFAIADYLIKENIWRVASVHADVKEDERSVADGATNFSDSHHVLTNGDDNEF